MPLKHLFKTSAFSAVAAALTLTLLPSVASAADDAQRMEQRDNRGSMARQDRAQRVESRAANRVQRSEARNAVREQRIDARSAMREQRRQPSVERSAPRGSGRDVARSDRGNWANRAAPATVANGRVNNRGGEAIARQRAEVRQQQSQTATRTWSDRNRSYSDRDRDRTYSDRRDGDWSRNRTYSDRDGDNNRNWNDRDRNYRDRDRDRNYSHRDRYNNYRDWDRNSWRRNQRYNWHGYRSSNRSVFRLGQYYAPYRDYRYSRVSIGFRLGSSFYGNRYWINDPWQYRLPEVYGPYRWVRYYDDVLLVNTYTGDVVDVIHDFFW